MSSPQRICLRHDGEKDSMGLSPCYILLFYRQCILFNPLQGCKTFVKFTTGFDLRPSPAAIIVMTPSGSSKEIWRARPALLSLWLRLLRSSPDDVHQTLPHVVHAYYRLRSFALSGAFLIPPALPVVAEFFKRLICF